MLSEEDGRHLFLEEGRCWAAIARAESEVCTAATAWRDSPTEGRARDLGVAVDALTEAKRQLRLHADKVQARMAAWVELSQLPRGPNVAARLTA